MNFFVPILILFLLLFSFAKKINAYSLFCEGAKKGIKLTLNLIPYVVTILLLVTLMQASGLTLLLCKFFSPIFSFFGIPLELTEFVCLRPFTGTGSLALLTQIISDFGTENKITKIACLIMMTTETTFFTSALYFGKTKNANTFKVLTISLFLSFIAMILSAFCISIV